MNAKSGDKDEIVKLLRCLEWAKALARKFAFIRGSLLLESAARNHPLKECAS